MCVSCLKLAMKVACSLPRESLPPTSLILRSFHSAGVTAGATGRGCVLPPHYIGYGVGVTSKIGTVIAAPTGLIPTSYLRHLRGLTMGRGVVVVVGGGVK
jgi:hypothetical protein